ncbi:Calx-beta domain-containing protein, partial [Anaerolineales bacterium HSG24]|nr:Calx-beta domain-containing protein [Anaerolineales bacterium HSG24]
DSPTVVPTIPPNTVAPTPVPATIAPTPATTTAPTSLPGPGDGTIQPSVTISFAESEQTIAENIGQTQITVTLSATSDKVVSVKYSTADETALAGVDYFPLDSTLVFSPGQTSAVINLSIIDDNGQEVDETLRLSLSEANNAEIGTPNQLSVTIVDDDPMPTMQFSQPDYLAYESEKLAVVTVTLSAVSQSPITATYQTVDSTALAGTDYVSQTGTVAFLPGQITQTIALTVLDDSEIEPTEYFIINLLEDAPAPPAVVAKPAPPKQITAYLPIIMSGEATYSALEGTASEPTPLESSIMPSQTIIDSATVTIISNEQPTVQFSQASYQVDEGAIEAIIAVNLNGASDITGTVDYRLLDGSAQVGQDYIAVGGRLTFNPISASVITFAVPIIDDLQNELVENLELQLFDFNQLIAGQIVTATLTIVDNDPQPTVQFSLDRYFINEVESTTRITVTLNSPSALTSTVHLTTKDGTAQAGLDYHPISQTLTFAPNQTKQAVDIAITDDLLHENNETISLTLDSPSQVALGTPSQARLTLIDNDSLPIVQWSNSIYQVSENEEQAVLTITLHALSGLPVMVNYKTDPPQGNKIGLAQPGTDYGPTNGTVTIPAGQQQQVITVSIQNDSAVEVTERFSVTLSAPVDAILGQPQTTEVDILDDDNAPTVQFTTISYHVNEADGEVVVTINLNTPLSINGQVSYTLDNATAIGGQDYLAGTGTISFAPGETSKTFTVPILDDAVIESSETFIIRLTDPVNLTLGTPNLALVTITDNDS